MKAHLRAVQRAYWVTVGCCVVCALAAVPAPRDAHVSAALSELERLAQGFDRERLEQAIANQAAAMAALRPASFLTQVQSEPTGPVTLDAQVTPLPGFVHVSLEDLASIDALTREDAQVAAFLPDGEALARALRWRLARYRHAGGFRVDSLTWKPARIAASALEAEPQVEQAQRALGEARLAWNVATNALERAERVHAYRTRARVKYKLVREAAERLREARHEESRTKRALAAARARYKTLAEAASALRAARPSSGEPSHGVVTAEVRRLPEGEPQQLRFSVPLTRQPVGITPLANVSFSETRTAGLWPEVAQRGLPNAIGYLAGQFSWHNRGVQLGGLTLGGSSVLQALGLVPLLLLLWLTRGCRRARASYNPFEATESLPAVGLGTTSANCAVLLLLPGAVTVLVNWSLLALGRIPVLALPLGVALMGTAFWTCRETSRLGSLQDEVRRTSLPPAAQAES